MAITTSFRIPEDLLREIDRYIKETKLDRSSYLREVLQKGFALDKQERLLMKYQRGEASWADVCRELSWPTWEFLKQLKSRNLHLNVSLEDWLDSAPLDNSN
ncbi:MAG: Ribbon-helix-helix protein, copG family [Deltaproteobacteria bacterium]|jgi:hypothetical protein|nr:Ribbon-helix-helix protein, copG family [Deltaproteobacteria bacterium]